ncbi:hypothetical protein ACFS5L_39880 [Streptomyces phyllanthi]|uniref:Uncharacterized protein n=1 Tax=Streptomyces phyllanthi TaxID=1803180 RepID=A0A5N8WEI4_9ACTN|nr:hypothetical protein [Streptomyces phyllanthi]MPY44868.1 hypothetical protein [Streptomyces phyllanthi]
MFAGAPLASAGPGEALTQPPCRESTLGAYHESVCWTEDAEGSATVTVTMKLQGETVNHCVLTEDEPLCRVQGTSAGHDHESRITANFETKTVRSDHEVCAPPQGGARSQCDEQDRSYRF